MAKQPSPQSWGENVAAGNGGIVPKQASAIRDQYQRAGSDRVRNLIVALHAMADLVQDYSSDPEQPNVSAWLRSGLVEELLAVEAEGAAALAFTDHAGAYCREYHPEGTCQWQQRCDEPGCKQEATCGFPTRPGGTGPNGGYRRTCGEHYRAFNPR